MKTFLLKALSFLLGTVACSYVEPLDWDRKVELVEIKTEQGKSKIWICNDPNCAEGCMSHDPAWGTGLLLERSKELEKKGL